MNKSFVIALSSIVFSLTVTNIADAKTLKSSKEMTGDAVCQNPVISSPKYNQIAREYADFNKDIITICKIINHKYMDYNKSRMMENNDLANTVYMTAFMSSKEVKSIKITNYSGDRRFKDRDTLTDIFVDIRLVKRYFSWRKDTNKWEMTTAQDMLNTLVITKREEGEWRITQDYLFNSRHRKVEDTDTY